MQQTSSASVLNTPILFPPCVFSTPTSTLVTPIFCPFSQYFVEYKLNTDDEELSGYSTNFLPYLGYASQIPNVLFNWVNIFVQLG